VAIAVLLVVGAFVAAKTFLTESASTDPSSAIAAQPSVQLPAPSSAAASNGPAPSSIGQGEAPAISNTVRLRIEVNPRYARVFLDGVRLKAPYVHSLTKDGTKHEIRVEAPGHNPKKVKFTSDADTNLVVALEAIPQKAAPRPEDDIYRPLGP
jgi:hypothetical protein